jgi:glucose-6-phosphate isomerase
MVNVGIGGSDLGPRSIYEALRPYGRPGRKVHFIANVDPDDAARVLDSVDLSRTLVNIVSKSGNTLETLANERIVVEKLKGAGLDPALHCLAVTGEGSPMDNPDRYLRSFYMYNYIGGRYSSSSMVGAVMLGFYLGYDRMLEFLRGAAEVDDECECRSIRENLPLLLAMLGIWNHNFLGYPTLAILPYSQALHRFPAHLQQCDMESNGKSINRQGRTLDYRTGPVIWGEPGTNGQHAFYQLLHQGTEIVPIEFIGFLRSQCACDLKVEGTTSQEKLLANMLAQAIALAMGQQSENPNKVFAGNRPSAVLIADQLDLKTMGALLAIYEAKIVFQGFVWNINSFDQEGVQLGKRLATRILDRMCSSQPHAGDVETRFLDAALGDSKHGIVR